MSTCTEPDCDQPRLVMPDNIALSTRWSAGREFVCVDTKPNGRTETAWCTEHFPSWLRGTHRVPRAPKPHVRPSQGYGGMTEHMAAAIAAHSAARRSTEPAESLTGAIQQFVEAYGGEPS